jgi:hypothetical protein
MEGNVVGSDVLRLKVEVEKAAKTVAFKWPNVVSEEDMEQELYLFLLERPGVIEKLLAEFDDKNRLNAVVALGHQIASKERDDYEVFSGNFRYSVNEVKGLLEDRALHHESPELGSNWSVSEDFIQGGEFEDTVLNKLASETDLRRGLKMLAAKNSNYAEIIQRRYLRDEVIPQSETGARDRLTRALTALTTEMNRSFKQQQKDHDGPGSRKPVTAQQAHYKSKANWDDESGEAVNRLIAQAKVSASR